MTLTPTTLKVALITGSSSGIGLGIAQKLIREGYSAMLNGIESPETLPDELSSLLSDTAHTAYQQADLADPLACQQLVEQTLKTFGRIDVLVNNAGIQHVSTAEDFPVEKWQQIIAINLTAAFLTAKYAIPEMKQRHWGRIINIASAHALVASPFKSAYVAAKHGVLGLTKTLALELAEHGITCNAVCPGYVKTPLVENQIADTARVRGISEDAVIKEVMLTPQPTQQFVSIEEVADYVAFLCTDSAKSITGCAQSIDGGWTAK